MNHASGTSQAIEPTRPLHSQFLPTIPYSFSLILPLSNPTTFP